MFTEFLIMSVPYAYVEFVSIDKKYNSSYNTYEGDATMKEIDDDIFVPTTEEMKKAKKRYEERIKKGITKNYNKYFNKLMKSFSDVRNNG